MTSSEPTKHLTNMWMSLTKINKNPPSLPHFAFVLGLPNLVLPLPKKQRWKKGVLKNEQKGRECQSMTQLIRVNLRNAIKSFILLPGNRSGQINTLLHTATRRFIICSEREREIRACVCPKLYLLPYTHQWHILNLISLPKNMKWCKVLWKPGKQAQAIETLLLTKFFTLKYSLEDIVLCKSCKYVSI